MSYLKLSREGLLRHSILLLFSGQLTNMAVLLFTMVMGRAMHANNRREFGYMTLMLGSVFILATPLRALRATITHFAARFHQTGQGGNIHRLLRRWTLLLTTTYWPVIAVIFFFRVQVTNYFHLPTPYPVNVMCVILLIMPFQPLLIGTLNGIQAFRWMAAIQITSSFFRVIAGTFLVIWIAPRAEFALTAHALAIFLTAILAYFAIHRKTKTLHRTEATLPHAGGYFFRTCILLTTLAILMYMEMPIVSRFLQDDVGSMAMASTIGRAVIMLPFPIAMAMFPKVTSETEITPSNLRTLNHGIVYSLLLMGTATGTCLCFPDLALRILFGTQPANPELLLLIRCTVLAMAPLGVAQLLLTFEMAQHRFSSLPGCILSALLYIVGAALWHDSVWQVVTLLACSSLVFLITTCWCLRTIIRKSLGLSWKVGLQTKASSEEHGS